MMISNYWKRQTPALLGATLFIGLCILSACNTNADAVSVLQSENAAMRATIDSYKNIEPTITAQATEVAMKLATTQADLSTTRAQLRAFTAGSNANTIATAAPNPADTTGGQPNMLPANNQGGDSMDTSTSPNPTQPVINTQPTPLLPDQPVETPVVDGKTYALITVVTTRGVDSKGCAQGQANLFSTTDAKIWVVADVRNFKKGTKFDVTWTDGSAFNHQNDWVANYAGSDCVSFWIEPQTLNMAGGAYSVTFTATGLTPKTAQFTVQAPTTSQ